MDCLAVSLVALSLTGCSLFLDGGEASPCSDEDCADAAPFDDRDFCVTLDFGQPEKIEIRLGNAGDELDSARHPSFPEDNPSEIFFSHRPNQDNRRIYTAVMDDQGDFVDGRVIADLPSGDAAFPHVSPDGNVLRFTGRSDEQIYEITRDGDDWSEPVPLPEYGVGDEVYPPRPLPGSSSFEVYGSKRTGKSDLYSLDPDQDEKLVDVNDDALGALYPWVSEDGLALAYSRRQMSGDEEMYLAVRITPDASWPKGDLIAPLSSTEKEIHPWLSEDLCTIYFSRQDSESPNQYEIYRAQRLLQ
ncbi:MAG: hypothetical protein KJO07_22535 [Deltaproteobacteria bacterium]|nr:hypothetical protein [Deltaproteobacteria bacterium]